jgi:hypothetical protein
MKRILKSIRYKLVSIWIFKLSINNIKNWFYLRKKLFQLWWIDAPKHQKQLEKGVHYLKLGAVYQVGQPIKIKDVKNNIKLRYIDNLFYNFKANKVTYTLSDRPIKGYTHLFKK